MADYQGRMSTSSDKRDLNLRLNHLSYRLTASLGAEYTSIIVQINARDRPFLAEPKI